MQMTDASPKNCQMSLRSPCAPPEVRGQQNEQAEPVQARVFPDAEQTSQWQKGQPPQTTMSTQTHPESNEQGYKRGHRHLHMGKTSGCEHERIEAGDDGYNREYRPAISIAP